MANLTAPRTLWAPGRWRTRSVPDRSAVREVPVAAAARAAELAGRGEVEVLMKGSLASEELIRAGFFAGALK